MRPTLLGFNRARKIDALHRLLDVHSSPDGMWVSGPNVAPLYLDDHPDNRTMKRVDADGRLWHCTGDRITCDADGWWYGGRASQPAGEFELEQRVYARLGSSAVG